MIDHDGDPGDVQIYGRIADAPEPVRAAFAEVNLEDAAWLAEHEPGSYEMLLARLRELPWFRARPWEEEVRKRRDAAAAARPDDAPAEDRHGAVRAPARDVVAPPRALPDGADDRPTIEAGEREDAINAAAFAALVAGEPNLYARGGQLVYVTPEGAIRPYGPGYLSERLAATIAWRTYDERAQGWKPGHPPRWCVTTLTETGAERPGARPLRDVVRHPVLRPDGTVLQEAGYDPATGLLYLPSGDYPEVPASPSRENAAEAAAWLRAWVGEFPWADGHDAAWLALVLTLVARHALPGAPLPMFLFEANQPGAGKTLAATVAVILATGHAPTSVGAPGDGDEWLKSLLAAAECPAPTLFLDNVTGTFGGAHLNRVLTDRRVRGRRLGTATFVDLPWDSVVVVTANNTRVAPDTHRRAVYARMVAAEDRTARRGFARDPLADAAHAEHPTAVGCALAILRAYAAARAAGAPPPGAPLASFEGWSRLVVDAVRWATGLDPLAAAHGWQSETDTTREEAAAWIAAWAQLCPAGEAMSIGDAEDALSDGGGPLLRKLVAEKSRGRMSPAKVIGYAFRKYKDVWVDSRRLTIKGETRDHSKTWCVEDKLTPEERSAGDAAGDQKRASPAASPAEDDEFDRGLR